MTQIARQLGRWAVELEPTDQEMALARRALLDTVAVALAGAREPLRDLVADLSDACRWAALAHVLDFDDLHLPSTAHVSAVCVPAALAAGGDERSFLAGAGVMARLGSTLGWPHYRAGWHATCTAGAPGAAVAAGVALGLDADRLASAIALAIPAAGGVQHAFGTDAKPLQVGFAADAGVRAAELAAAGAGADLAALEQWLGLVGGDLRWLRPAEDAVPAGLAIKLFPCCYALQRPIAAVLALGGLAPGQVRSIAVRAPESSLTPLIHHRPRTGLQGKFSLQYGIAAALLDGWPELESFTDGAVARPQAQRLAELVEVEATPGGEGLLAGELEIEVELEDRTRRSATLAVPPGAPGQPPTDEELQRKLQICVGAGDGEVAALTWASAAAYLRDSL